MRLQFGNEMKLLIARIAAPFVAVAIGLLAVVIGNSAMALEPRDLPFESGTKPIPPMVVYPADALPNDPDGRKHMRSGPRLGVSIDGLWTCTPDRIAKTNVVRCQPKERK